MVVKNVAMGLIPLVALVQIGHQAHKNFDLQGRLRQQIALNEYYVGMLNRHEVPVTEFDKIALNNLIGSDIY